MNNKIKAFTLAELLVTLAIIGVVAAITLPVVINKINEKQYDIARRKFYNSVSQAIKILAIEGELNQASDAEEFINDYLSKKLKIIKYCGSSFLDCGFSNKIKKLGSDEEVNMPYRSGGQSFLTNDGFSVYLIYNSSCNNKYKGTEYYHYESFCINALYDMNGNRKPNQVGKDIGFMSAFYPSEEIKVVAPLPAAKDSLGGESYNVSKYCDKGETLPDMEELLSMVSNKALLVNFDTKSYWSSTYISVDLAYSINAGTSAIYQSPIFHTNSARCVKR